MIINRRHKLNWIIISLLICGVTLFVNPIYAKSNNEIIIDSIELDGDLNNKVIEIINLYKGEICDQRQVYSLKTELSDWHDENGFILAKFLISLNQTNQNCILKVKSDRGSKWLLGDVKLNNYEKNYSKEKKDSSVFFTKTKPNVLAKMTKLNEGDVFSVKNLNLAEERLWRSGYFEEINLRLARDPIRNVIYPVFDLKDAKSSRIEAMVGYDSENFQGFVDLELNNIGGTARNLKASINILDDYQEVNISYKEPWLFASPINLLLGGEIIRLDTTYGRDYGEIGLSMALGFRAEVSLFSGYQRVYDTDSLSQNEFSEESWINRLEYSWSSFNRAIWPSSGIRFWGSSEFPYQISDSTRSYDFSTKLKASFAGVLSLKNENKFVLSYEIKGLAAYPSISSDEFIIRTKLFEMGGVNSVLGLRGYKERSLITDRAVVLSQEFAWRVNRYNSLFVFGDEAWLDDLKIGFNPDLYLGYGLGWEQKKSSWTIALMLALNADTALNGGNYDLANQFRNALIHLRVANYF